MPTFDSLDGGCSSFTDPRAIHDESDPGGKAERTGEMCLKEICAGQAVH